ncbi:MAG: AMP-binding protein [Bacilli bacterium]
MENKKNNIQLKPSEEKIWLKYAKRAKTNLPDSNMNLLDYIYECNKNNLDEVALEYDPINDYETAKITYRKLFEMIDICAYNYMKMGVKKGDKITVCLPSFIENIINFYALNKIGAVPNQIHPLASKEEMKFYLEEVSSKYLVAHMGNYDNFKDVVEQLDIEKVIIVDAKDFIPIKIKLDILKKQLVGKNIKEKLTIIKKMTTNEYLENKRYMSFKKLLKKPIVLPKTSANCDQDAIAALTHTSGTSGKSKAVMTSPFAFNEMVRQIAEETPNLKRGDTELLVLPPYPMYVLCNNVHMCLARGIKIIVVPKVDLKNINQYFKKHKISAVQGIPIHIQAMLKDENFQNTDLSTMKFLVSGGGYISPKMIKETNEFLKNHGASINLTIGYGMSEMGSCSTCTFGDSSLTDTVGRPLNDTIIKIVDTKTSQELSYNQEGEIYISGPCMMNGYYNNEIATEEIMEKDKNGITWVKTGDYGTLYPDGNLKYGGRIKRKTLIFDPNTNTVSKISHDYVEGIIKENNQVEDIVIVPTEDEYSHQAIKAYIVVKDNPYKVIKEIDKKCRETLRKYTRPIEYIVIDDIPKTSAGKNDYRYLEKIEQTKEVPSKVKVLTKIPIKER